MSTIDTDPVMIIDKKRMGWTWLMQDLFIPGGSGGRYVPNKNDQVIEWREASYLVHRVIDVNYTTGKSDLQVMREVPYSTGGEIEDQILSNAPGRPSSAFRIYVDASVKPATMSLDRQCYFLGTMAKKVLVFRGTDINEQTGEIISAMYDQNTKQFLGDYIPLEHVATAKIPNANVLEGDAVAVKIMAGGYCNKVIPDNELVTVVAYADDNSIVRIQEAIVFNTSFARSPDAFRKYVTGIGIVSPFLSDGDDSLLEFPLNMPLESIIAKGVVHYNDGSKREMAIDGTKFRISGLYANRFLTSSPGQEASLVLHYILDPEEFYLGQAIGSYRHVSKRMRAVTLPANNAYSIRLFAYPQWIGPSVGYQMRYFLTTLARDRLYDVTAQVRLGMNSPVFDPLLYGANQNLILTVDMDKVDGNFAAYKYVQPVQIALLNDGTNQNDIWSVNMAPAQPTAFGLGLKVWGDYKSAARYDLDISMDAGSKDDWLNKMFYSTQPLFNPSAELRAPAPTHFNLVIGEFRSTDHLVSGWNSLLSVTAIPNPGELILFEWILRDGNGDHVMGVSAVPFFQVD